MSVRAKRTSGAGGKAAPKVKPKRAGSWTKTKQAEFLEHLAATANVRGSARAVEMSETGLYKLRARSAEFRAAWAAALREGYSRLELMLLDRAMNGTVKPVFHAGQRVDEITEYSERLALTLLAAHRQAVHGDSEASPRDHEAARKRIEEKLDEMHRRLGGEA